MIINGRIYTNTRCGIIGSKSKICKKTWRIVPIFLAQILRKSLTVLFKYAYVFSKYLFSKILAFFIQIFCKILIRKRRSFKVMAVITLWSFLLSLGGGLFLESAGAESGLTGIPAVSAVSTLSPSIFDIPNYLGEIKEEWHGDSDKLVIHIQDAHCNYDCQHAIADLIDHFRLVSRVNIVNLEGGVGEYDLTDFMDIRDARTREKTADHFVKEGNINGAEYYAITNPRKIRLWGVEDLKLYGKNLQAYRLTDASKKDIDVDINKLIFLTNELKAKYYSEELLLLDMKLEEYKNEDVKLEQFFNFIRNIAIDKKIPLTQYEDLELLKQSFAIEKTIDFEQAQKQRSGLIDKMTDHLSKKEIKELLRKSVQFKTGEISSGDFYAYLFVRVKFLNLDMSQYKELNKYREYVSTYTKIKKDLVYEEILNLTDAIKQNLYQSKKQKYINDISQKMELLRKLFDAAITEQEYKVYKQKGWIPLFKYLMLLKEDVSVQDIAIAQDLQKFIPAMESFYEYSYSRDDVFVKNLKFSKNRTFKKQTALLVTGGFHSDNLFNKFKEQGISYVSIQPCFGIEKDADNKYF